MQTIIFRNQPISLPSAWSEISYVDAINMQEVTINNAILYYLKLDSANIESEAYTYLESVFAFLLEQMPDIDYNVVHILDQNYFVWDGFKYSFEEGVKRASGFDLLAMSWPQAFPLVNAYTEMLTQINTFFGELKDDVRSEIAKQAQPDGFWAGIETWIDLKNMGMPLNVDRNEFMKQVPLLNYFQEMQLQHRSTIAQNRANRISGQLK